MLIDQGSFFPFALNLKRKSRLILAFVFQPSHRFLSLWFLSLTWLATHESYMRPLCSWMEMLCPYYMRQARHQKGELLKGWLASLLSVLFKFHITSCNVSLCLHLSFIYTYGVRVHRIRWCMCAKPQQSSLGDCPWEGLFCTLKLFPVPFPE